MIHAATDAAWHSAGAAELPIIEIKLPGAIDGRSPSHRHDWTAGDLRDLTFVASKVGKQLNTAVREVEADELRVTVGVEYRDITSEVFSLNLKELS